MPVSLGQKPSFPPPINTAFVSRRLKQSQFYGFKQTQTHCTGPQWVFCIRTAFSACIEFIICSCYRVRRHREAITLTPHSGPPLLMKTSCCSEEADMRRNVIRRPWNAAQKRVTGQNYLKCYLVSAIMGLYICFHYTRSL